MKKYYFESIFRSLIYVVISLILVGYIVLCCYTDEIHSGVIFIIVFLSISVIAISFWAGFSFSMRIQIDYDKQELYIRHPYFIKRIKFEDVVSIQIIEYNKVAFDFVITTKSQTKKMAYARYYRKKPTEKRISKINELKQDLMNISNKNY